MKKRKGDDWFPFWIDKWIFGSTRDELTIEQCAVWIDFLALSHKDEGYIRANEGIPYPIKRLAGLLNRPEKLIKETIKRCLDPKVNKLRQEEDGTLFVLSHKDYELSKRHKRRLNGDDVRKDGHTVQKTDTKSREEKRRIDKNRIKKKYRIIKRNKVIDYFNEITKQKRSYTCDETNKFINGRIEEGRTFRDFKHVIDTKTAQWINDPQMKKYLRPSTLFRPGKFEDYLNEPYEKLREDPKKEVEDKFPVSNSLWTQTAQMIADNFKKENAVEFAEVRKNNDKKGHAELDSDMFREIGSFKIECEKVFLNPKNREEWKKRPQDAKSLIEFIEKRK